MKSAWASRIKQNGQIDRLYLSVPLLSILLLSCSARHNQCIFICVCGYCTEIPSKGFAHWKFKSSRCENEIVFVCLFMCLYAHFVGCRLFVWCETRYESVFSLSISCALMQQSINLQSIITKCISDMVARNIIIHQACDSIRLDMNEQTFKKNKEAKKGNEEIENEALESGSNYPGEGPLPWWIFDLSK